jgi:ABC-type transport system involved in multi-copper enzyme maturation permease subunit
MNTIWIVAQGTFGEAMRRKILNVFLFVAIAMIIMGFAFSSLDPRQELVIVRSLGLGVIQLAGVFISVILGINLIPNEIERRTIYTILSKPVQRYEFLLGKFVGGLMTVAMNIVLMGAVFFLLVSWKEGHANVDILKGILMTFFQLFLVSSIAVFFSAFLSPFVNFFLTFAVFLLGSMSSVIESLGTQDGKKSALTVDFFKFLHLVLPNFGNFNIENPIIHPEVIVTSEGKYILITIGYAIVYSAFVLTAAVLIFDKREL